MAKTPFSPMEQWSGRIGSEVYAVKNGRQVIRNYAPKTQTPTIRQQLIQDKFKDAAAYYRELRPPIPYNQFIKAYFRNTDYYNSPLIIHDLQLLEAGDMLFFDKVNHRYCFLRKQNIHQFLKKYDTRRYETFYDTYEGTIDGVAHFVAITDAYSQTGMYTGEGDTAAANNYYRIEIDNTLQGGIQFYSLAGETSMNIGSAESPAEVTWDANESMTSIVDKFTALNKSTNEFTALADGKGVGIKVGGYSTNTLTVVNSTGATVIDCSGLSFLRSQNPAAPAVDGDFNPNAAWTYLGYGVHRSFRGSTARTILGSALVTSSTTAIAVDGYNYSSRCGLNFAKFKSWATLGGESTFYDDGEDGQSGGSHVANPGAHVMNEATFNIGVRDYTGSDVQHLGMKDYYTHLFTDQTGDYATWRKTLESRYGQMTSMYDAYLMNHMLDAGANSGITSMMRNKGFNQTVAKADLMTVTYDYKIIPAYPPEYNAQQYGIADSEGFAPGVYYHPEPADLELRYRDDNFALINANVDTVNALHAGTGTKITTSDYRGSCADCKDISTWYFYGAHGCFDYTGRYFGSFRCRPSLAIVVQSLAQLQQQSRSININQEEYIEPTPEETPIEEQEQNMR